MATFPKQVKTTPPPMTTLAPVAETMTQPEEVVAAEAALEQTPQTTAEPEVTQAPAPTPEPTAAPAPVVTTVVAKQTAPAPSDASAFQKKINVLMQEGSVREKHVIATMKAYIEAMAPGKTMSDREGVAQQMVLWNVINNAVSHDEDFDKVFNLVIMFFREFKDSSLHENYVYRFTDSMTTGKDAIAAFLNMVNLLKVAAGLKNKKDIRQQVDLNRTMNATFNEAARQRVIGYFS